MFSIIKKKIKGNVEQINEDGFIMGRKNAIFEVNDSKVKNIMICNKYLANPVVYVKVNSLYKKLINLLTDLLTEDDGSGNGYREALNQIERFRMVIKNKYRDYLFKEDLEKMSKKLVIIQKEAKNKIVELNNYRINEVKRGSNNRSR